MTFDQRNEIFAKDYLSIADVQILLGINYNAAAKIIREIRDQTDRLHMQGKIHVQDYIDYFNLNIDRYVPSKVDGSVSS